MWEGMLCNHLYDCTRAPSACWAQDLARFRSELIHRAA
jgi:hypothetical protein